MQYKYEYKGMSINDYCELHNIKKFTIYSRIRKVKLENPNLDQDELVNEAFKRYYAHEHILYFYNNTALYNYCLKNPDIKYKRIRQWVSKELQKNPKQSIEYLINAYINGENNKNRWFYLGIPLKNFCLHNDISYDSIRYYLLQLTKKPKYATWSDDKLVAYLVEKRFKQKNLSLEEYCLSLNFPYDAMHNLLKQELKKYPDLKFSQILHSVIITINYYRLTNYGKLKQQPKVIKTYLEDSTNNIRYQEVAKFLKLQR